MCRDTREVAETGYEESCSSRKSNSDATQLAGVVGTDDTGDYLGHSADVDGGETEGSVHTEGPEKTAEAYAMQTVGMGVIDDKHDAHFEDPEYSADDCAALLDSADGSEDVYVEWCILAKRGECTGMQPDIDYNDCRLV